jgi:hypothetical protein
MTNCTLHLREFEYASNVWRESKVCGGVRFSLRRISLGQRIELTRRVHELTLRNEFLLSGAQADQIEATLGDLLARRLYLEWGLAEVHGLVIDGVTATTELLIEKGPEVLADEIVACILSELQLTEEERKNF